MRFANFIRVVPFVAVMTLAGCGTENDLDLCQKCLSSDGPCSQGCCEIGGDPVARCQTYVAALCQRGKDCAPGGSSSLFCDVDCTGLNGCELMGFAAYPAEQQVCLESIPGATCDDTVEGVWVQETAACHSWLSLVQAAIDDSTCHQEEGGESRIQAAGGI